MLPTNAELLEDLRRVEELRAQKQAAFMRALEDRVPQEQLCALKADLDALTQLATTVIHRVVRGASTTATAEPGTRDGEAVHG